MENKRQVISVKSWVINKAQQDASRYNCFFTYAERDENGAAITDGEYTKVVIEEVIAETEKAVQVRLQTGDVIGSSNGWKLWIPKSQIA